MRHPQVEFSTFAPLSRRPIPDIADALLRLSAVESALLLPAPNVAYPDKVIEGPDAPVKRKSGEDRQPEKDIEEVGGGIRSENNGQKRSDTGTGKACY